MKIDHARLRELSRHGRYALDLGKAAEHLVCADLILQGYRCYLSDQGLPYDVIIDVGAKERGFQFLRLQVKAACFPRGTGAHLRKNAICYSFGVRHIGKKHRSRLTDSDCDIVAFVALDISAIAYLPIGEVGQTCQLMRPDHPFKGKYKRRHLTAIDEMPFSAALRRVGKAHV